MAVVLHSRTDVRVVLVGDEGVGKSSIVSALLHEEFHPQVDAVVGEVTVPEHVTPDRVTTHITDTSEREEYKEQMESALRRANVVCIVYAVDNSKSFERVTAYWLPLLRRLGVNVPVVLVGNKIDVRGTNMNNPSLEQDTLPIMTDWKEVETTIECSAKCVLNISEVFYFARKAVLHPTAPLFDTQTMDLKPKAAEALGRIFKLCDQDKDGLLNDTELNGFQRFCFGVALEPSELEDVKRLIQGRDPSGVADGGVTPEGFLLLHAMVIQRGRLETTWTVLRKFGYDDDLQLRKDYLTPSLNFGHDQRCELSRSGYAFFTDLFCAHDKDMDGALSPEEMDDLFATAPCNPWANTNLADITVTNKAGWITLKGWLALWSMTTALHPTMTLEYLAYLGFNLHGKAGLHVTRRRAELRKQRVSDRNVLVCYMIGPKGAGLTSLLRAHIGRPFSEEPSPDTTSTYTVVNTVEANGDEKYLVLRELPIHEHEKFLKDRDALNTADLVAFVYDSSDPLSFEKVARLMEMDHHIPGHVLVLASKSDRDLVNQRYDVRPHELCERLGFPPPVSVSAKDGSYVDAYMLMTQTALQIKRAKDRKDSGSGSSLWTYALLGALLAATAYTGYRLIKSKQRPVGTLTQ